MKRIAAMLLLAALALALLTGCAVSEADAVSKANGYLHYDPDTGQYEIRAKKGTLTADTVSTITEIKDGMTEEDLVGRESWAIQYVRDDVVAIVVLIDASSGELLGFNTAMEPQRN